MQTVLLIASGIISCYIFILVFRIIASWFSGSRYGRAWEVLRVITDPVLNIFRGVGFLRRGAMDFTPILAILVLQITAMLLRYIAVSPVISVVTILAAVALSVWQTIVWIFIFFAILAIVRIVSILFIKRPPVRIFHVVDGILALPVRIVMRCLPRGRDRGYLLVLVIVLILLAGICFLGFFFIEPSLFVLLGWRTGI
jgi:uncharacterized protein YggT (Ycf19 family)